MLIENKIYYYLNNKVYSTNVDTGEVACWRSVDAEYDSLYTVYGNFVVDVDIRTDLCTLNHLKNLIAKYATGTVPLVLSSGRSAIRTIHAINTHIPGHKFYARIDSRSSTFLLKDTHLLAGCDVEFTITYTIDYGMRAQEADQMFSDTRDLILSLKKMSIPVKVLDSESDICDYEVQKLNSL